MVKKSLIFRYQTYLFCLILLKWNCCWIPWTKISWLNKNWTRLRAVCVQNRAEQFWILLLLFLMEVLGLSQFGRKMILQLNKLRNVLIEWFNDSLKIDLFHYWINDSNTNTFLTAAFRFRFPNLVLAHQYGQRPLIFAVQTEFRHDNGLNLADFRISLNLANFRWMI